MPTSITVLGDEDSLGEFKDLILAKYPNAQITPSVMADATNPAKKKILISIPLDKDVRKLEDLLTLGK